MVTSQDNQATLSLSRAALARAGAIPPAHVGNFTVNEFLAWAKIGRTKFYAEVQAGNIKIRKIGRKTVVTGPDALAYRDGLPEAA